MTVHKFSDSYSPYFETAFAENLVWYLLQYQSVQEKKSKTRHIDAGRQHTSSIWS